MAAGQLGKGVPGGLKEMPEPPYSRGSWWWRPGTANLIYCHFTAQTARALAGDKVLRGVFLGKGGERVPCWSSEPTAAWTTGTPASGTNLAVVAGLSQ